MNTNLIKTAFSKISFLTVIMVSIIAVPFVLGKYCELNIPGAFDSGAYTYSAKHILSGAEIGVDEQPTAKISTLLVNMLGVKLFGYNDAGPKIIQGFMQAAALILIFLGLNKHFGRAGAFVSTLIASIYISAPVIAKYGNVKEQYLTACIGISIGAFFLYYGGGKKIWAVLSGAALAFAPGFKETGISITGAMAVFLAASAIMRWKPVKAVLKDSLLIVAGMAVTLVPLHIWLAAGNVPMGSPYEFLPRYISKAFEGAASFTEQPKTEGKDDNNGQDSGGGYLGGSRKLMGIKEQAPVVLRYYKALMLPICLALLAFIIAKYRNAKELLGKKKPRMELADRLVFLPATCWILDMIFVWISPRSYEQYYIPLTLSGAVTGGYVIWLYARSARQAQNNSKPRFGFGAFIAAIIMLSMSWNVFAGFDHTFHSGKKYPNDRREKGFVQQLKQASLHRQGRLSSWEVAARFIRQNSTEADRIYVWGWFPGIYVQAQRLCPYKKAFESEMHVRSPAELEKRVNGLLESFKETKPLFIVDSRKRHFPWDRPALEFLPSTPEGFLPKNEAIVRQYERQYSQLLKDKFGADEAKRFEALAPLRKYIRENYYIVGKSDYKFSSRGIGHPKLGSHVIFKRKN